MAAVMQCVPRIRCCGGGVTQEWAGPSSGADVRSFAASLASPISGNHYLKFVLHFSALVASLGAFCSPRARCAWSDAEKRSFDALRGRRESGTSGLRSRPHRCCACGTPLARRACSPTPRSSLCLPFSSSPTMALNGFACH